MAPVPFCVLFGIVIMAWSVNVNGQFFTKTDKAVPRLGRRMDPSMMPQSNGNDQAAVPISQEIVYPIMSSSGNYVKPATLEDIRKWSPKANFYDG